MPAKEKNRNEILPGHDSAVLTVAPLVNVSLALTALQRAMDRPSHLPGMVCLYGPSGWGKSTAATYTANRLRAYYIELKSTWTKKAALLGILADMGIQPAKTVYEMVDQICEQLVNSGRPLIIDELDHMVEKKSVEIIRDIYEGSGATILLIGEEMLPKKLEKWERFHGRILEWVGAQPADIEDCRHLARLYCRQVEIRADLLERIHRLADGSVRRVCVNLERVQEEAAATGLDSIGLKEWGNKPLYTGKSPVSRRV